MGDRSIYPQYRDLRTRDLDFYIPDLIENALLIFKKVTNIPLHLSPSIKMLINKLQYIRLNFFIIIAIETSLLSKHVGLSSFTNTISTTGSSDSQESVLPVGLLSLS